MDPPIRYSRRGGACIGGFNGTWPFGKIEIREGAVTVRLLGARRTLTVAEVLRVEPLGFLAGDDGPGVRIFCRGKFWDESVDFYSLSARDEVLAELKIAGFNVVDVPRS
ncbi:MAG TPA: hypothetical protein VMF52_07950 [Steroidobacteraceae bacterium]|nr:hypothetical protein [Steroidobacteraceae bacterium]